jgi:hypothetical protein
MASNAEFKSTFADFYPYYLSEHSNRTSRRLHFVGTVAFVAQWLLAVPTSRPLLWLTGPLTGYAFAWVGHFFFEKNRPATFRQPFYSLLGDFVMAGDILRGRIRW